MAAPREWETVEVRVAALLEKSLELKVSVVRVGEAASARARLSAPDAVDVGFPSPSRHLPLYRWVNAGNEALAARFPPVAIRCPRPAVAAPGASAARGGPVRQAGPQGRRRAPCPPSANESAQNPYKLQSSRSSSSPPIPGWVERGCFWTSVLPRSAWMRRVGRPSPS